MKTTLWGIAALVVVGCGGLASSNGGDAGTDRGPTSGVDGAVMDARDAVGSSADAHRFTEERIVFLVETSGAMVVLDPLKARAQAINQVLLDHKGDTNDEFAVITFDSMIVTAAGFSHALDVATIDASVSQANDLNDYEGALDAVATLIDTDAKATPAATLAQTRYVVVLLAGSTPDPQCTADVTPCGSTTCPAMMYCTLGNCYEEYSICTIPRADWATAFSPPLNPSLYPDLLAGADYNTAALVDQKVADIVALQSKDKIGSVELDTVLVFDPSAAKNPLSAPFRLSRGVSTQWLKQLAKAGGGTYVDLSTTSKLPF
jgi:hypothetical protein